MKALLVTMSVVLALSVAVSDQTSRKANAGTNLPAWNPARDAAAKAVRPTAGSSAEGLVEARSNTPGRASSRYNLPSQKASPVKGVESLCAMNEQVLLSWAVIKSGKLVSLCGSKDFGKDKGYIQYRFGRPGAVELEFPKDTAATQGQFTYSHYFRAKVDRTAISFKTDRTYTLEDDYEGESGKDTWTHDITVESPDGKKETRIACKSLLKRAQFDKLAEALPNVDFVGGR